jgi:Ca2+-transporting ATPase
MQQAPRQASTFLSLKKLGISIVTEVGITIGVLFVYQLTNKMEQQTLTNNGIYHFSFSKLMYSQSFVLLFCFASLKNKNNMMVIANSLTLLFLALIVYINPIARLMFFHCSYRKLRFALA